LITRVVVAVGGSLDKRLAREDIEINAESALNRWLLLL
jgi:hypothetical protein